MNLDGLQQCQALTPRILCNTLFGMQGDWLIFEGGHIIGRLHHIDIRV